MVLVALAIVAVFVELGSFSEGLDLVGRAGTASAAEIAGWQEQLETVVGLYVLILIAAGIAVFAWLSRVVDNIAALGGGQPLVSPRWAIGWWFVPIANLVQPARIVADAWRRLATDPRERGTLIVAAWWIAWITGGLIDRVVASTAAHIDDVPGARSAITMELLAFALIAAAGVMLIRIIWDIERRSRIRASSLSARPAPATPPMAVTSAGPTALALPTTIAFCPRCGTRRLPDAVFCAACGTDLGALSG